MDKKPTGPNGALVDGCYKNVDIPTGKVCTGDVWKFNYYGDVEETNAIFGIMGKEVAWVEYGRIVCTDHNNLLRLVERDGVRIDHDEPEKFYRKVTKRDIEARHMPVEFCDDREFPDNKVCTGRVIGSANNALTGHGYVRCLGDDIDVFEYARIEMLREH
jgi:hypothetical protein